MTGALNVKANLTSKDEETRAVASANFTDQDKLLCLARELQLRRRVYPRLIGSGRMHASEAQREIELMEAIVADYRAKVQPSLALAP